ncbi:DUF2897 family protein [Thalassotalea mangrovi]|uniref:DUF2897 family protein n=1 Tax=Thalassotalea mangrovi TaxID=2572245 RepID=A0A4V5NW04_9GAMM|nr:DUF2897 family protein [Thalassotalea mangrovi]TKB44359.1 DUF2897 family protein [Thalassotalea mangrovi]
MNTWLIVLIIVLGLAIIIGNLSMLQKSARPIRRKSLNELEETLPRAGDKRAQQPRPKK